MDVVGDDEVGRRVVGINVGKAVGACVGPGVVGVDVEGRLIVGANVGKAVGDFVGLGVVGVDVEGRFVVGANVGENVGDMVGSNVVGVEVDVAAVILIVAGIIVSSTPIIDGSSVFISVGVVDGLPSDVDEGLVVLSIVSFPMMISFDTNGGASPSVSTKKSSSAGSCKLFDVFSSRFAVLDKTRRCNLIGSPATGSVGDSNNRHTISIAELFIFKIRQLRLPFIAMDILSAAIMPMLLYLR